MDGESLCWLHGPAGAGKSAIEQTVAEACASRGQLAASFFSRSSRNGIKIKCLFLTIVFQIAVSPHNKREKLANILDVDPHIVDRASGSVDLLVRLLDGPLVPSFLPFLIVIDGLEECHGNDDVSLILAQILALVQDHHLPFRFFLIFSRPEPHIRDTFDSPPMENLTKKMSLYGNTALAKMSCITFGASLPAYMAQRGTRTSCS